MYSSFKFIILSFPVRLAFFLSEAGMVTAYTFDSHEFSISLSVSFGPWSVASQLRRARCWMDPLLLVKIELKTTVSRTRCNADVIIFRNSHRFSMMLLCLDDAPALPSRNTGKWRFLESRDHPRKAMILVVTIAIRQNHRFCLAVSFGKVAQREGGVYFGTSFSQEAIPKCSTTS